MTAQGAGLSLRNHGDISLLAKAIYSSWKYSKMILQKIEDGDIDKLFKREIKGDSIKLSPYPRLLAEFAKDPANSRSVPGKETISISYNVYAPKFLLIKPRITVIKGFKEKNPECKFSLSVLNHE